MPALWSGNLRLSLVLIPVRLHAATTEARVAFRQIHAPSGTPIRYVKGVRDGDTFTEVPDDEIIKGYEHAKGHHVLIDPKEIDDLKLEAKHTIDMVRFVDEAEIDSRYLEKPYYLTPDGDDADEGYVVIREALKATGKVAIGQLVMHGRAHLVGHQAVRQGTHAPDPSLCRRGSGRGALFQADHFHSGSRCRGTGQEVSWGHIRTVPA